jgi:hypothetical protein
MVLTESHDLLACVNWTHDLAALQTNLKTQIRFMMTMNMI